jgi:hypothetical protein
MLQKGKATSPGKSDLLPVWESRNPVVEDG